MKSIKLSYDLHIHSCLSPCGDDSSTPANIVGLASILGLDVIALTDHNTCKNCPAFFRAAEETNVLPIAGMELDTAEEIHVLCLFPSLTDAMRFDAFVALHIPPIENKVEIFGNQLIMDENDTILATEKFSLITATDIDLYTLSTTIKRYNGIIIPAHIDRSSYSIISSLGFVPPDSGFSSVEIKYKEGVQNLKKKHDYLNVCNIIHDSDAHMLENMSLPENFLEVQEKSAISILKLLDSPAG